MFCLVYMNMAVLQQSFLPKITASFTLFYIEGTYVFIPRRVNEVFLMNDERYNTTKAFILLARFVVFFVLCISSHHMHVYPSKSEPSENNNSKTESKHHSLSFFPSSSGILKSFDVVIGWNKTSVVKTMKIKHNQKKSLSNTAATWTQSLV